MQCITETRFYTDGIPGGASTILQPANCGTDVTEIVKAFSGDRDFVVVRLETSDPRLQKLLELLAYHGKEPSFLRYDVFTLDELASARLIVLDPNGFCEIDGDVGWSTTFDLTGTCPGCYAASRQTQPYIITNEEDLPRIEGKRLVTSYWNHILVDDRLADALIATGATGLSFHPVYARIGKTRQIKMHWKQLVAGRVLPRMSPQIVGLEQDQACPLCGRTGYGRIPEQPKRFVYNASDLTDTLDVNETWEGFGFAGLDDNNRPLLLSVPRFVVTPKVWRVLHDAGVDAVTFLPIRVV